MSLSPLLDESDPQPTESPQDRKRPSDRSRGGASGPAVARLCEATLDVSVVVLSTWTVVYHLCLVLRLGVGWAVGFEAGALAAALAVRSWWRRRPAPGARRPAPEPASSPRRPAARTMFELAALAACVVAAGAAALLVAAGGNWPLVSALWLVAAVAGTALAVRRLGRAPGPAPAAERADGRDRSARRSAVVALAWSTGLAALSMFARRPNPDDLYYVNLAQWVVEHGTFPLRDTIFSDLVYPMSSWPPMASYDALAGTLGWLGGVPAATVVYLVVPPVATFLSVLALWRLLREWRVGATGIALSLALVFLLFNGGAGYAAPGTLFLTRIWQGKVILLCLLVPTLLVHALRYVERPTVARGAWMFAGGVAAVGLTTSAMFLVPLVALAGMAPLGPRRPGRALAGFAAMSAYPLAAGVVTLLVDGRSADLFATRKLFRFDPAWFGPEILRDGPTAFVAVAAVFAGTLLLPLVAARVTAGVLTIIVGVTFVPGVTHAAFDVIGLGPTLWRVSWILPIAALVGALAVRLGAYGRFRGRMVVAPVALAAALMLSGTPIWSSATGTVVDRTPQWKRNPADVATADRAIEVAAPGDVILASEPLAITVTVMTTRIKTIAPRDYFMDYMRDEPAFRYAERQALLAFANDTADTAATPAAAHALDVLDVDMACLPSWRHRGVGSLLDAGFRHLFNTADHTCLRR